jgi:hypothetical protein
LIGIAVVHHGSRLLARSCDRHPRTPSSYRSVEGRRRDPRTTAAPLATLGHARARAALGSWRAAHRQ